jgi:hypothetical protein
VGRGCRIQEFMMYETGITKHTAPDWQSFCHKFCLGFVGWYSKKVGCPGMIVEIDKAKIGKKYNRGHFIEGQWVLGDIERVSGKFFIIPVPDWSAEVLLEIICKWVLPTTTIILDCWRVYNKLNNQ